MPIKVLGWIHILLAGGILFAGAAFAVDLAVTWDADSLKLMQILGPPFGFFAMAILIPELLGGIGLLARKDWARVIITIVSAILLLMFPLGTVLGGFGLWALLGAEGRAAFGRN